MGEDIILQGFLPEPSFIIARDEDAAQMIMGSLHQDFSQKPPVVVLEEWPENWNVNAAVVTPIHVIGTEGVASFGIVSGTSGEPLTEDERKFINAFIRLKMSQGGDHINYRDYSTYLNWSRNKISRIARDLDKKGIGRARSKTGFTLNIGSWRPDVNKAKALGLKIKEY
ncbi:MAG: hypothetical protein GWN00_33310 [Aliifodinibius sp.]|nr:hypothetical protein [Phycisphaerae bacterium]NIR67018.1 hypothetical protein [candidate division Zixibacteria bacterium]NIT60913.1 hypothetical protein [Fodinibius sp.]NIW48957.1 hypothetical protein [Gammaproteobacteria bacterium]NIS48439.1 hypothetical protein [candidate division Zixibacteria bacterium]